MFPSRPQAHAAARALGWLGIGIGITLLLAPRQMARAVGVPDHSPAMRGCGLREVATGVTLLASARPTTWLWAHAAGHVLDAGLLARALRSERGAAPRLALLALGTLALADWVLARRLSRHAPVPAVDYTRRSGFPLAAQQMRGVARGDHTVPADLRVPQALRPWRSEPGQRAVRDDSVAASDDISRDTTQGTPIGMPRDIAG
jgi:hypothetical protein